MTTNVSGGLAGSDSGWSWSSADVPHLQTESVSIDAAAPPHSAAWQIDPAGGVLTECMPLAWPRLKALAIRVGAPRIKTFGFTFLDASPAAALSASDVATTPTNRPAPGAPAVEAGFGAPPSVTRLKPPSDVIKLEDRLYYLLQPPLETLVSAGALRFPFEPFPYQLQGVAFLYPRYAAILADEMGLGKTMQAITAIRLLLYSGEIRSVLLVCPKPLVTNWQREFGLWAPEVPLSIIEGDRARRHWQWTQAQMPLKIANYELLLRDRDLIEDPQLHFDLVVLDEAQRIKNRSSTTSQVARSIARERSWALTGTPIENRTEDLVSIFDFLLPGHLSPEMHARRMGRAVQDYLLRRTKDMVLSELPPKIFRDADLYLTAEQWESYRAAEQDGVVRLRGLGEEMTIQHVFELVLRLKQICNFDPASGASSKLERLTADLEEVAASGEKAIVFSQWVDTLKQIRGGLEHLHPLEYHGKIPTRQRDDVLRRFREDRKHHVLLMSYGAGSVGLNLQFCSYVFLFDRWWNPAVEDQAINRAHRIGATGPVVVTRMLTLATIEQRIHQVLEEKRELFATILSHTGAPRHTGLTQADILGLFDLGGISF